MPRYTRAQLAAAAREALRDDTTSAEQREQLRQLDQLAGKIDRAEQRLRQLESDRDQLIRQLAAEGTSRIVLAGLARRTPDRIDGIKRLRPRPR